MGTDLILEPDILSCQAEARRLALSTW